MNLSSASYLIILLAIVFANTPFFNERCFALFSLQRFPIKPFWFRLFELIILYFVLLWLAFYIESLAGNRFEQKWEFFAITGFFFCILSFPGFVLRYLKK